MEILKLICNNCSMEFNRYKKVHLKDIKRGRVNTYCSIKCLGEFKRTYVEYNCAYCNNLVRKNKRNVHSTDIEANKFCNRQCYFDYQKPKEKYNKCKYCECIININEGKRSKVCLSCKIKNGTSVGKSFGDCTKGELFNRRKNYQSARSSIVKQANRIYKKYINILYCANCKYDKHIEVAHIKDVKDFPDTARLSEINAIQNLMALCPNCHWEFDNNLLQVGGTNNTIQRS